MSDRSPSRWFPRRLPPLIAALTLALAGCGASTIDDHQRLAKGTDLGKLAGRKVFIEGRVSKAPGQHPVQPSPSHPVISYVDWSGGQMVVYAKSAVPRDKRLRIFGTLVRITTRTKGGKPWTVYHLRADRWKTY